MPKSTVDTPYGLFNVTWGLDSEGATQIGCDFYQGKSIGQVKVHDPVYGEEKVLDVYRVTTNSERLFLLGEITNGIWACGTLITGEDQ